MPTGCGGGEKESASRSATEAADEAFVWIGAICTRRPLAAVRVLFWISVRAKNLHLFSVFNLISTRG